MFRNRGKVKRRGFTLIELVVVVAIIGILAALLIPAVQQAREAARRAQCRKNLNQILDGLSRYHEVYNQFPLGGVCKSGANCGIDYRHDAWTTTWAIAILPYIEQEPLWNKWNSSLSPGNIEGLPDNTNEEVTSYPIPVYRCPSARERPPARNPDGQPGIFSKGNYGVNYGGGSANVSTGPNGCSGKPTWQGTNVPAWANAENRGVFSSRCGPKFITFGARESEIRDGTTNTLLIAEILGVPSDNDTRGAWGRHMGAIVSAFGRGRPTDGPEFIATPNAPTDAQPFGHINFRDAPTHCENSPANVPPESLCEDAPNARARGGVVARSKHDGGVFIGLAGGAVQFRTNSMDKFIWRALFTIHGAEPTLD